MTSKKTETKTDAAEAKPKAAPVEKSKAVPATVSALAKEAGEDVKQLLGWKVYDDRVVIIGASGAKFVKVTNGS
jgi:hypothetical protein